MVATCSFYSHGGPAQVRVALKDAYIGQYTGLLTPSGRLSENIAPEFQQVTRSKQPELCGTLPGIRLSRYAPRTGPLRDEHADTKTKYLSSPNAP
jgi:hypothetical protein